MLTAPWAGFYLFKYTLYGGLCPRYAYLKGSAERMSTIESSSDPHRQQRLYWDQMYELKVAACYIRLYRDHLGRWVTGLGAIKAIASCGGIAAWAIWKQYAFVWGAIIAASQLADALKDVFPFAKKHKASCVHAMTLSSLFIDVQLEWENIFSGRYSDDEIMKRLHQLRKLQLEAENHDFPDGLATMNTLLDHAKQEATEYCKATYGVS